MISSLSVQTKWKWTLTVTPEMTACAFPAVLLSEVGGDHHVVARVPLHGRLARPFLRGLVAQGSRPWDLVQKYYFHFHGRDEPPARTIVG